MPIYSLDDIRAGAPEHLRGASDSTLLAEYSKSIGVDPVQVAQFLGVGQSGGLASNRIGAGIDRYQAGLYGLGEAAAGALGAEGASGWMRQQREANELQADISQQRARDLGGVESYKDIGGVGDFLNYAGGLAAQTLPYLGEAAVGGLAVRGAMSGTRAALNAARGTGDVAAAARAQRALNLGSSAGVVGATYPSAVADILQSQREAGDGQTDLGSALLGGVPYAAANVVGLEGAVGRMGGFRSVGRALDEAGSAADATLRARLGGAAMRAGATGARVGLTEGAAETAQEGVNQYFGRMAVDPNETMFSPEAMDRYAESFVGGATLGGLGGAGLGGWRRSQQWQERQQGELLRQIQLAGEVEAAKAKSTPPVDLLATQPQPPEQPTSTPGEQLEMFGEEFAPQAGPVRPADVPEAPMSGRRDRSTPLFDAAPTSTVRTDFSLPQVRQWITQGAGKSDQYALKLAKRVSDNIDRPDALEAELLDEVDRVGAARTTTATTEYRLAALDAAMQVVQRYKDQMGGALRTETNLWADRAIERPIAPGAVVGPIGPQPNLTEQEMRARNAQLRFESELESTDARVAAERERTSTEARRAILQRVFDANPAPGTILMRFNQALKNEGFTRNATPEEAATIKRYVDVLKAQPEVTVEKSTKDQGQWYEKRQRAKKAPKARPAPAPAAAPATTPTPAPVEQAAAQAPVPVAAPTPTPAPTVRTRRPRASALAAAMRDLEREVDAEIAAEAAAPAPAPAAAPATPARGGMRAATVDKRAEELATAREELAQAEARFNRLKALPQTNKQRQVMESEYFEARARVRAAEKTLEKKAPTAAPAPAAAPATRLITPNAPAKTEPAASETKAEDSALAVTDGVMELDRALEKYRSQPRGTRIYDRQMHQRLKQDAVSYIYEVADDPGEPAAVREHAANLLKSIDPKDLPKVDKIGQPGATITRAVTATNAVEALQILRADMDKRWHPLIDRLMRMPRMDEVKVQFGERQGINLATYDWNARTITLRPGASDASALHELVHAATMREMSRHFQGKRLQPVTEEAQALMRLMGEVRDLARQQGLGDEYAFTSPFEFVAEAFSNPDIQGLMQGTQNRSLWRKFTDLVRRLLGRPPAERAMFDELVELTETYFRGPGGPARYVADAQSTTVNKDAPANWGIPEPQETTRMQTAWNVVRAGVTDWRNNPGVLGWLSLRQLEQRFGGDGGSPLVSRYIRAALNAERRAKEITADSHKPIVLWQNLPAKDQTDLGRVMLEATMARAHVDKAWDDPLNAHLMPNTKGMSERDAESAVADAKAEFDRVKKLYDDLVARSPRTAQIYAGVRDAAAKQWEDMANARINEIIRAYKPTLLPYFSEKELQDLVREPAKSRADFKQLADNASMKQNARRALRDLLDAAETHYEEVGQMKGPYFPLVRFGDHVVVVKSDAFKKTHAEFEQARQALQDLYDTDPPTDVEQEAEFNEQVKEAQRELRDARRKVELLKGTDRHYMVEFYEHRWEADNRAKQLAAAQKAGSMDAGLSVAVEQRTKHYQQFDSASPQFVRKLEEQLRRTLPKADAGAVQNAVRELYLRTLPDRSALKSELRRLNVAGAKPTEMMRGFATRSVANAHRISRMEYGGEMQDALNDMRASEDTDTMLVGEEFAKRMIKTLAEPRRNVVFERLAQGAHLTFLGMSPSYLLINMSQPWAISVPIMAQKHGIMRSGTELGNAVGEVMRSMKAQRAEEAKNLKEAGVPWSQARAFRFDLDIDKLGKTDNERRMLRELYNDGLIDITIEHDMGAVATGAEDNWFDKVNQIASTPAHLIEVVNRVATSLAAYRLEAGKDASENRHEGAVKYATDIVGDTHLDYGAENAPRLMRPDSLGGMGRIVWQFKKYLQGMIYLQAKLLKGALKGDREALKGLAYLNGAVVGVSGMVGMPLAGGVGMLATAIAQLWEDDDEPDFGQMFYNGLKDTVGETTAQLLWKGAPAAMGIDLSQRMSMSFAPLPFVDWNKSGRDLYANILVNLGGPASAMMANWFDAASMADKDPAKAFTLAMPKVLADPVRAYQMADQGIRSRAGDELISPEEFNSAQVYLRGLGFQPTKVADMYEKRSAINAAKARQREVRNTLIQQFKDARRSNKDTTSVMNEIAEFNKRNPANRITQATLIQSLRRDQQSQRRMVGGAIVSPREADVLGRVGLAE